MQTVPYVAEGVTRSCPIFCLPCSQEQVLGVISTCYSHSGVVDISPNPQMSGVYDNGLGSVINHIRGSSYNNFRDCIAHKRRLLNCYEQSAHIFRH